MKLALNIKFECMSQLVLRRGYSIASSQATCSVSVLFRHTSHFRQETILNKIFLTGNQCSHFPELFCKWNQKINKTDTNGTSHTHTCWFCVLSKAIPLTFFASYCSILLFCDTFCFTWYTNVETGRDAEGVGSQWDPVISHQNQCTNMTSTKPETWVKK